MSESIMNGLGEHPKQSYRVGKNLVDHVARVNSGRLERSEETGALTKFSVGLVEVVFAGRAFAFNAFDSLVLKADFRVAFGGLTTP